MKGLQILGFLMMGSLGSCASQMDPLGKRTSLFGSALPANEVPAPKEEPNPLLLGLGSTKMEVQNAPKNNVENGQVNPDAYLYRQQLMRSRELQKVEGNVWRTSSHPNSVFGILVKLLSQNYVLRNIDRRNFSLTTDWDKFFVEGRLFRNRINVTVFPLNNRQTEVIVKNFVEYYSGSPQTTEETISSWLPSPDITDEVSRIIESMNRQIALRESRAAKLR